MAEVLLPSEWIQSTIGEVAHNANNLRKPISLTERAEIKGTFPYYGATGQIDSLNDYTHDGEYVLIGEDGANLLSKSKPLAFIARGRYWVNNHAHSLKAQADMPSEFISHYVNSLDLAQWITGSAQPKLTKGNLESIPFPLPPLAEQKVIAQKLDTLLAQVETTKARLDRIPDILKRFRQSVLAAAVSGKLTEEWQVNELAVHEVCIAAFDGPFGSKLKSSDYTNDGVRVVRLENIGHLYFDDSKRTFVGIDKYNTLQKNTLKPGDVLISSFVDEEVRVCLFQQANCVFINKADCFCLRSDVSIVDPAYLTYTLASVTSYMQIKSEVQGVTRPRINLKILKNLSFDFPSLEEQSEIVKRVEALFAHANSIEKKVQAAQARVNSLTQTILAKAFRGELTAEWRAANPELISGENSAEALLEKIRAEREAVKPKRKTKSKA